jgi:cell wall-associated NlpC family hydrolase
MPDKQVLIFMKFYFYTILITFFFILGNSFPVKAQVGDSHSQNNLADTITLLKKSDSIIVYALKFMGTRYKYGSCSPSAFDCSGFTYYVFNHFDISLPRASYLMAGIGKVVALRECQKGDLIFFKGSDIKSKKIGHVGIVISSPGEPVMFIHASINKGVTITPLSSAHYKPRFVKVMRIL